MNCLCEKNTCIIVADGSNVYLVEAAHTGLPVDTAAGDKPPAMTRTSCFRPADAYFCGWGPGLCGDVSTYQTRSNAVEHERFPCQRVLRETSVGRRLVAFEACIGRRSLCRKSKSGERRGQEHGHVRQRRGGRDCQAGVGGRGRVSVELCFSRVLDRERDAISSLPCPRSPRILRPPPTHGPPSPAPSAPRRSPRQPSLRHRRH